MEKDTPFKIAVKIAVKIAAVVVVGVPVLVLALGMIGFVIKWPFPQNADITLTMSSDKLVIGDVSGNLGDCKEFKEKGCVGVSKWRKANIKFRLVDMDDWSFSQIQLVAEASKNAKLNFGTQAGFTKDMINDFYIKIDSKKVAPNTDGIIHLKDLKNGDVFKLVDRNNYKQTYSYQIQACPEVGVCIDMDPKVMNEGKK